MERKTKLLIRAGFAAGLGSICGGIFMLQIFATKRRRFKKAKKWYFSQRKHRKISRKK